MLRLPHRWIAALLWLAISLLPLRGVAAVWMHGAPALAAASVVAEGSAQAVAMPCHGQTVPHDAAPSSELPPAGTSHSCQLCDLCHSGVAVAPEAPALVPLAAAPAPLLGGTARAARHASDGLYRPPR